MGITMAVVASMEQEVSALKRLCPDEWCTGVRYGGGQGKAMEGMVALLDARPTRPDCILSLGFAGALRAELKTGDLVLSQRLYATGEDTRTRIGCLTLEPGPGRTG